jgi:hypothetical protein
MTSTLLVTYVCSCLVGSLLVPGPPLSGSRSPGILGTKAMIKWKLILVGFSSKTFCSFPQTRQVIEVQISQSYHSYCISLTLKWQAPGQSAWIVPVKQAVPGKQDSESKVLQSPDQARLSHCHPCSDIHLMGRCSSLGCMGSQECVRTGWCPNGLVPQSPVWAVARSFSDTLSHCRIPWEWCLSSEVLVKPFRDRSLGVSAHNPLPVLRGLLMGAAFLIIMITHKQWNFQTVNLHWWTHLPYFGYASGWGNPKSILYVWCHLLVSTGES